jgi:hypothetical protein
MIHETRKTSLSLVCYALISLSIVSCRASDPVALCPATFTQNNERAKTLWKRLGQTSSAAALMRRGVSKPPICFGQTDISTITTTGVIYFDDKLDESEGTARLGHLFTHFVDGMPMAKPRSTDCEAQVDEALRAESAALSIELQLRKELAVTNRRIQYPFEGPYWATVPDKREALIFDFLQAHPDGAPGIDALAAGYAKRCREAKKP